MDFLEYPGVSAEIRGAMVGGLLKLSDSEVIFKHGKTGRKDVVKASLCRRAIHNIDGFLVLRIYRPIMYDLILEFVSSQADDIELLNWQRLAGAWGIRIFTKDGELHRCLPHPYWN